jgi:hypothetical protein
VSTIGALYSVWGSGPSDVFAVGVDFFLERGAVLHYDGQSWQQMPTTAASEIPIGT